MPKNILNKNSNSITIDVQVLLFKEGETWVTYCPALELSSYGVSIEDAKTAFDECLNIFINETSKRGTLEICLLKLGWQLQQKPLPVYNQPVISLQENKEIFRKNPQFYNEKIAIPIMA
jgi:hypothetical protein